LLIAIALIISARPSKGSACAQRRAPLRTFRFGYTHGQALLRTVSRPSYRHRRQMAARAATCSTTCHLLWLRPRYTGYRPLPMRSPYQRGRQTQRVCTAARWVAYRSLWLALLFIANALSCQRVRQRQRVYAATRSTAYRLLWLRARHTCYGSLPVRRHIHTAVKGGARARVVLHCIPLAVATYTRHRRYCSLSLRHHANAAGETAHVCSDTPNCVTCGGFRHRTCAVASCHCAYPITRPSKDATCPSAY
jgi:hypothetical protein